jgi:hypothetical protein
LLAVRCITAHHTKCRLTLCAGDSKFDELIQRNDIPSRIRPRTESCAVGPNGNTPYNQIKKKYKSQPEVAQTSDCTPPFHQHHAQKLVILSAPLFFLLIKAMTLILFSPTPSLSSRSILSRQCTYHVRLRMNPSSFAVCVVGTAFCRAKH